MSRASGGAASSTTKPAWLIVMIREVMVKVTDKAFIIGTLTTLGLIVAGFAVGFMISERPETTNVVVTTPQAAALAESVGTLIQQSSSNRSVQVVQVGQDSQARSQLETGDAEIYLHHTEAGWMTSWRSSVDDSFVSELRQVLNAQAIDDLARQAGVSAAEVNQQLAVNIEIAGATGSGGPIATIAAVIFGVLFMMSSMTYGMQIATSVIEEKQSRIVEILVAVIPVRQLLAGKVLGNTLIAFVQVVLLLGAGLIGMSLTGLSPYLSEFVGASGWFLVFFLAGFLALACIWAAAGALGTRTEDLNQTSTPLMWVIMATYLAAFVATGTTRTALSFAPIVSAVLMPARLLEGSVRWWEPVAALASNLVFALVMVLLGERIYRRALLRTGGRLNWRQGFKLTD